MASVLAHQAGFALVTLSAVSSGVKDVRDVLLAARERLAMENRRTCLFIDEIHRFNKSQQDLLLPATESGEIVLIGATTENPYFEVNAALLSRMTLWRLRAHTSESLGTLLDRGAGVLGKGVTADGRDALIATANGDGRAVLMTLQVAAAIAGTSAEVSLEHVRLARDSRIVHQNSDSHYDQSSALIKSIRGSDPDAALFWLVTMLESGESARFIARRLLILASEDVGLASSSALLVAEAAARAVEFIGLPEARLTLAHAVLELSLAPKSNSVTAALARANEAFRSIGHVVVPEHLRDGHYQGAGALGHGRDYVNPHETESGWVAQRYLPDGMNTPVFEPSGRPREQQLLASLNERRNEEGDV